MVKLRRYCWRVGAAFYLEEGGHCPECWDTKHRPIPRQNECGAYVPVTRSRGTYCTLPIGHAGDHAAPEAWKETE
jgi:hypothetical protein